MEFFAMGNKAFLSISGKDSKDEKSLMISLNDIENSISTSEIKVTLYEPEMFTLKGMANLLAFVFAISQKKIKIVIKSNEVINKFFADYQINKYGIKLEVMEG